MAQVDDSRVAEISEKFALLAPTMDERQTRLWLAAEAKALGRGGIAAVTRATGVLGKRIGMGLRELAQMALEPNEALVGPERVRRPGAGRKRLTEVDETLIDDLESLVAPETRGDPESLLRWTTKSVRRLADQLGKMGHKIGRQKVSELLHELGYSLQALSKTREGTDHLDRDAQFRHINRKAREFHAKGQPVISVDTKKKELIGDFHNNGREWQPKSNPESVRTHDFIDRDLGKAIPYGVYDIMRNEGWVNVGIDRDTAEFAVQSIRRWWYRMGRYAYPDATELLITADAGGSNGYRTRLWKYELDKLARDTALRITVAHYPPGTSKWKRDRASHVLVHHAELARTSAAQRSNRRQLDIEYDNAHRSEDQVRARHPKLRGSHQHLERGFCGHQPKAEPVPRRLELQHWLNKSPPIFPDGP